MAMAAIQPRARQYHNELVLNDLEEGDLVEFKRHGGGIFSNFSHWAVYVGEGRVVHLTGTNNNGLNANSNSGYIFTISGAVFNNAVVKKDHFWAVTKDSLAYKNNDKDKELAPDTRENIVERALSKLGHIDYNIISKNCEHFASWCRYGLERSEQSDNILWTLGGIIGGIAVLGIRMLSR